MRYKTSLVQFRLRRHTANQIYVARYLKNQTCQARHPRIQDTMSTKREKRQMLQNYLIPITKLYYSMINREWLLKIFLKKLLLHHPALVVQMTRYFIRKRNIQLFLCESQIRDRTLSTQEGVRRVFVGGHIIFQAYVDGS